MRTAGEDWLVRGATAELDGRLADAAAAFEQATLADPSSVRAWYRLGEVRAAMDLFDQAEDAYHQALALAQDDLPTWLSLGRLYGIAGRTRQQCFALSWLLMLDPTHVQARAELALALEARGEVWQAKRHWLKVLATRSEGAEADQARSRLHSDGRS